MRRLFYMFGAAMMMAACASPPATMPPTQTPPPEPTAIPPTATPAGPPPLADVIIETLADMPEPDIDPEEVEYQSVTVLDIPEADYGIAPQPGEQVAGRIPAPNTASGRGIYQMPYLLYLPEAYDEHPDVQWPMIVFLHGAGHQGDNPELVRTWGLPKVLEELEGGIPFIVVSPQAPSMARWETELGNIDLLVQTLAQEHRIDESRIYVTGLSMGGYGSWAMAMYYPDQFAAVASVSGSAYFPPESDPNPEETFCQLAEVPVWGIHGAQDDISLARLNADFIDQLRDCSTDAQVEWTLWDGFDHFSTVERIYQDPALYEWLLQHTN